MDVKEAIRERRAYRSLDPVEITDDLLGELVESARLAPSCFNSQPWRFVFVHDKLVLERVFRTLSSGNKWATKSSLIIAVCSKRNYDCVTYGREYYLFDTGMATAFIILRATEMGLVAHPIAGFGEDQVKEALKVPKDITIITLVIVGVRSKTIDPMLSNSQRASERKRPKRMSQDEFAFSNQYPGRPGR